MNLKNAVAFLPLFLPITLASFVLDTIKTSALTCEPLLLQWQGGKTPWTLSIIATDGSVLEDLETTAATSFHWTVNFEAGTAVAARVADSTGATATSNTFTIQSGSTGCTLKNVLPAQTEVLQPAKTDSNSPLLSPTIEQTLTTSPTSGGASPVSTVGTSSASQGLNPTISPVPPATAIQQFPSPSSSVAAFSSISTSRKPSAGGILGIVIAVVIFLVIVGLGLARWLRRRAGASSEGAFFDLEAQSSPPRWMDRPIYEAPSSNRFTSTNETQEPQALRTRPDVDVLPPPGAPSVAPRTEFTPGTNGVALTPKSRDTSLPSPYSEADATTNYVGSLESRIQALTEANAILADLARPSDSPPPAYN